MNPDRIKARVPVIDLQDPRYSPAERASLRRLARSTNARERRLCVDYLWEGVYVPANRRFVLELAEKLVPDRSKNVRWGALHALGLLAERDPEMVWPLVAKWGSVASRDIRMGIACCILEHLLGLDFARYFERVREVIDGGNRRFASTFAYCHKFDDAQQPPNARAWDSYLAKLRERGDASPL